MAYEINDAGRNLVREKERFATTINRRLYLMCDDITIKTKYFPQAVDGSIQYDSIDWFLSSLVDIGSDFMMYMFIASMRQVTTEKYKCFRLNDKSYFSRDHVYGGWIHHDRKGYESREVVYKKILHVNRKNSTNISNQKSWNV